MCCYISQWPNTRLEYQILKFKLQLSKKETNKLVYLHLFFRQQLIKQSKHYYFDYFPSKFLFQFWNNCKFLIVEWLMNLSWFLDDARRYMYQNRQSECQFSAFGINCTIKACYDLVLMVLILTGCQCTNYTTMNNLAS